MIPRPLKIILTCVCGQIRQQCEESLKRLDTDYIDLYYQHRVDPETPIEETMACLKELKEEGKIKYVGLSECTADELRRAHAVMPVSAIQMEWSLQVGGGAVFVLVCETRCYSQILKKCVCTHHEVLGGVTTLVRSIVALLQTHTQAAELYSVLDFGVCANQAVLI